MSMTRIRYGRACRKTAAFASSAASHGSHVTAGIYWLPAQRVAERSGRFERLRDYLKWVVDEGRPVYGVVLPLVFDIDRAHDVEAAEQAGLHRSPENARA